MTLSSWAAIALLIPFSFPRVEQKSSETPTSAATGQVERCRRNISDTQCNDKAAAGERAEDIAPRIHVAVFPAGPTTCTPAHGCFEVVAGASSFGSVPEFEWGESKVSD